MVLTFVNNTEYVVDSSVQIEDNCQEDLITNIKDASIHTTLGEYLTRTLCPQTIRTTLFVWQPPEHLIFIDSRMDA
jgi:hypothetical protein